MSLFRPRKPFMSTFRISYFPHFAAWKVAGFVSKSYGFGAQEHFPTGPKPMVLETNSAFRRGQERVGEGLRCRLLKLGLTKIIWPIGC